MKLSGLLYVVIVLLALVWAVTAQLTLDCGSSSLDTRIPRFISVSVFPKAVVGQKVHVYAVVQLPSGIQTGDIQNGTLSMDLSFGDTSFANIQGIPLCNASSSIVCSSLGPGNNNINFDYMVPDIPAGTYTIQIRVAPSLSTVLNGCMQFQIDVSNPGADKNKYVSEIQAILAATAQFEHADYMQRTLGELVQIGPIGPIAPILSYNFPWGTFVSLEGSGDLVPPDFNPQGYVWGLTGEMVQMTYQGTTREQVYTGDFNVGWVSSLSKRTFDVPILSGTFVLSWLITQNNGVMNSILSGNVSFDDTADLPFGWSNPILVGRLGPLSLATNSEGILMMQGQQYTCLADPNCKTNLHHSAGGNSFPHWAIGMIVAIFVGVILVILIIVAAVRWHRKNRRHEQEHGIFSAARKPEYGNALVVDDIIQETREHSPKMLPPIRDREDYSDDDSEYSRRSRSRSRSRSRTPDSYANRSRSASPRRSRSRSGERSDEDSDYTDAGSSASRV